MFETVLVPFDNSFLIHVTFVTTAEFIKTAPPGYYATTRTVLNTFPYSYIKCFVYMIMYEYISYYMVLHLCAHHISFRANV